MGSCASKTEDDDAPNEQATKDVNPEEEEENDENAKRDKATIDEEGVIENEQNNIVYVDSDDDDDIAPSQVKEKAASRAKKENDASQKKSVRDADPSLSSSSSPDSDDDESDDSDSSGDDEPRRNMRDVTNKLYLPRESFPRIDIMLETDVSPYPGEPVLTHGTNNFITQKSSTSLSIVKSEEHAYTVKQNNQGWHDLILKQAAELPGSTKGMAGGMMAMIRQENPDKPLCYMRRDKNKSGKTSTSFQILSPEKAGDGDKPTKLLGLQDQALYTFASINFDLKHKVCTIHIVGQDKLARPLYMLRQADATTWILRKEKVKPCAILHHHDDPPSKSKFNNNAAHNTTATVFDIEMSPGVDPVFVIALVPIIVRFKALTVEKRWTFYYEEVVV